MPVLKRPPEKQWVFKQPQEPYMRLPCSTIMLAPSGGGKTSTIVSLITGPYARCFESIHIFSPSVHVDSSWDIVKEFAKGLKESTFSDEWNVGQIEEILSKQKGLIREQKAAKRTKPLSQILLVCDDWADDPVVVHRSEGILQTLFCRGRHAGISVFCASQKLRALATIVRVNARNLLIWRLRNQKEIVALLEELSAIYPVETLHQMYTQAVEDQPFSWWYINLIAKEKTRMFFIRFEHRQVVEDVSPQELLAAAPRPDGLEPEPAQQL
jgi:hypothetical protein